MKLCVVGSGYVGLVSGACFAELGHEITCVDANPQVIATLKAGQSPIYEPGLAELIRTNAAAGRLHFSEDSAASLADADIVLIAVGTPPRPDDGQADLTHVFTAAETISRHAKPGTVVVTKSTVPVGTNRRLAALLKEREAGLEAASNPEFLREGNAIEDFLQPERIVVGVESAHGRERLEALYTPFLARGVPMVVSDLETAEMIKYAANSFLAAKVAFINEMADICESVGADVTTVARAVGMDSRIGPKFLKPGPGFGGSCFPKDTLALVQICHARNIPAPITDAVVSSNLDRRFRMVAKIEAAFGGSLRDKRIGVLGLTFKPQTNDMRESPALAILPLLLERGARIVAYDPEGMVNARSLLPEEIHFTATAEGALQNADGAVLITEWPQFRELGLDAIKRCLAFPLLIDLRNVFDPADAKAAGLQYHSVGRASV